METLNNYVNKNRKKINAFVILKPGFLDYEDEWKKYLSLNDWKIKDYYQTRLSKDQARELYTNMSDQPFFFKLCDYMSGDDCICATCYKDCSNPIGDMKKLKDKIRDQWGEDEMRNAMHSSDSVDNVIREYNITKG